MRIFQNKKGYSATELMMVFALFALFCMLGFTLIQTGSGAYDKISQNRSNKAFARVALSYVENRVHQGDMTGKIYVREHPEYAGENVLVISDITDIEGEQLWILRRDDNLIECYVLKGEKIQIDNFTKICDIGEFNVMKMGSLIRLEVKYTIDNKIISQLRIITLRSEGQGR